MCDMKRRKGDWWVADSRGAADKRKPSFPSVEFFVCLTFSVRVHALASLPSSRLSSFITFWTFLSCKITLKHQNDQQFSNHIYHSKHFLLPI